MLNVALHIQGDSAGLFSKWKGCREGNLKSWDIHPRKNIKKKQSYIKWA